MNIVYVFSDGLTEYNSSQFRVSYIADAIRRAGHTVNIINIRQWMEQTEECRYLCARADIIILQRVLVSNTHEYIKKWTSLGKAVVPDWDDSYDRILDSNAAADFWLHGKVSIKTSAGFSYDKKLEDHPLEQFKRGLGLCTAGITPSERLSKDWENILPTFVVKNFLDDNYYLRQSKKPNKHILMGWGGSLSHTQSWEDSGIQEALQRVLQERDNVKLFLIGDDRIRNQIPIRKESIMFHPYVTWAHWPQYLRMYDIGLAPLAGEYDDRRSSLKVSEYLLMGIPFLATKSVVYEEFWDVDSGIFIEAGDDKEHYDDRVESWYKSAIAILDNLLEYNERAIRNTSIGMQYSADANVTNVLATYEKIIRIAKE